MSASTLSRDQAATTPWNAVILYHEYESGLKAKALLDRASQQGGESNDAEVQLWRFDVMQEPEVAREALEKALEADIVLLAAEEVQHPPEWLLEWLESWALQRRVREALLAAWCGNKVGEALAESVKLLRQLAGKHGLDFLCADHTVHRGPDGVWSAA